MKIAIDASRAINEKAGIGRISLELIRALLKVDKKNQYLLIFTYFRKDSGKEKLIKSFEGPKSQTKVLKIPGKLKEKVWGWRMPVLNRIVKECDIFLAPSFFEVNLGLKIPQVLIIYDLSTFLFPEQRGVAVSERLNERAKIACKKAKKIIAISEATKKDLTDILKINLGKIEVIYPGLTKFPKIAKNLPGNLKSKSYILAVGTIEPRKNLIGLFKGYALLPPKLQEKYPLVVVGAKGWNTGETFRVVEGLRLGKKIKFLGYVTDEKVAKLYKEAAVFVYPSLYEGFGLPVAEAMQFGTPVITSNVSSMPEAAGKASLLVNPEDPKTITRAIQRLLEHRDEAEKLSEIAKIQAAKFSWEKMAKKTLKVLEEL